MLSFAPTEEQEEIRNLVRSLALEQLRPRAREADRTGQVPSDLLLTLARTGLTTPFPVTFGGSGPIEAMNYVLVAEELGFGDGALAMDVIGSLMGPVTVLLTGDEQQQHLYLPPFCDERTGSTRHGSLAFAERTGGYTLNDISATLRVEGENVIINGNKRDVVRGAESSPRVLLLRQEGSSGHEGLCALVVPDEVADLQIIPDTHKLGLIAAASASYIFHEVKVPVSYQLGTLENPGVIRAATLYELLRAGVACGMARAGLEYARDYARQRIAFGRPIVSYQGIAFMFSEMAMKLDAARLLLWQAAVSWDQNVDLPPLIRQAESAHFQCLKIAKSATIDTIQILGGAGFIQDHPAEMWMRDAAAMD